MAPTVPGQKINLPLPVFSPDQYVRGRSERRTDCVFSLVAQLIHLVQTAPTDNPDRRRAIVGLRHAEMKTRIARIVTNHMSFNESRSFHSQGALTGAYASFAQ